MANRPKPSHLKLVRGNPGKRAVNKREPKPRREIPSPPAHLSDRGKVAWGKVSVILDRMGVLTEADAFALEMLCETYADILDARENLQGGRYQTVITKSGDSMERARPALSDLQDADRRFRAWLVEFGLTPSARSRVKTEGEKEEDPLAEFL